MSSKLVGPRAARAPSRGKIAREPRRYAADARRVAREIPLLADDSDRALVRVAPARELARELVDPDQPNTNASHQQDDARRSRAARGVEHGPRSACRRARSSCGFNARNARTPDKLPPPPMPTSVPTAAIRPETTMTKSKANQGFALRRRRRRSRLRCRAPRRSARKTQRRSTNVKTTSRCPRSGSTSSPGAASGRTSRASRS